MSVFYAAIEAHLHWRVRLANYIDGNSSENLDPAVIACDDKCDLGQWIHANQDSFKDHPYFTEVMHDHAEFHKTAAGIVVLCHSGQQQMAAENLRGPYANISRKVIKGIVRLASEVDGQEFSAVGEG